jgi:hypothetical protein
MLRKAKVQLLRNVEARPVQRERRGRTRLTLRTGIHQPIFRGSESDAAKRSEQRELSGLLECRRSELRNGLTARQRGFILEKLVGLNDKDAALAAGYSVSVAENTKQRIWKPRVREQFERLRQQFSKE